ncbi:MAG: EamA family transporter [Pseudomonadota bacterium]|nr:EamA family transporter [Pseudomonadota bacterium]
MSAFPAERVKPYLALIIMTLLWGYGWTALKIGLIDAPPFLFSAVRMTLSALFLLAVLYASGRPFLPKRRPELITLGLVQTSLLFTLSTCAVDQGTAGRIAFLVYTMPFFTLVLAWSILGEKIKGLQWIAITLAVLGLSAILQPWSLGENATGNLLGIAAGAVWAISVILVKRIQERQPMDLISMTAWQMAFGCIPLLGITIVIGEDPIIWSTRFVTVLLLISIVITGFGWLLWVYALDRLEAGTASLITLASPVIAIGTSAIHLGEAPTSIEAVGMLLITLALIVLGVHAFKV